MLASRIESSDIRARVGLCVTDQNRVPRSLCQSSGKHEDQATIELFPIRCCRRQFTVSQLDESRLDFPNKLVGFKETCVLQVKQCPLETLVFERHHPKTPPVSTALAWRDSAHGDPQDFALEIRPLTPAIHPGLFDLMQGLLGLRVTSGQQPRATAAIHATGPDIASLYRFFALTPTVRP